ncbi:hypothetical protein SFC88_11590 [Nocardioides sp. HM23]|uniref:hypothetical protein n=1 Tax=Nocardioides bizhenqiangii TaxID=3095076 RepID=UPI002ACA3EA8|nr:hypothetical protein [Nocardioides sp. HM23]MDZ5621477.1 hypothetical protein [Nocardioides sp. HM23]
MTSHAASPEPEGLDALFESSPDLDVHTSAAAETGFLLGLVAITAAPFSVMHSVALGSGLLGTVLAFRGVVATSSANVAGRALAPFGLALAGVALLLVSVRYLGVDTAFGDELLPTLRGWLEDLNSRVNRP